MPWDASHLHSPPLDLNHAVTMPLASGEIEQGDYGIQNHQAQIVSIVS